MARTKISPALHDKIYNFLLNDYGVDKLNAALSGINISVSLDVFKASIVEYLYDSNNDAKFFTVAFAQDKTDDIVKDFCQWFIF